MLEPTTRPAPAGGPAGPDCDSSSELSSILSSAPSTPADYPLTPPDSSQDGGEADSNSNTNETKKRKREDGGEPSLPSEKKKRKRPERKPRTTERLNLGGPQPAVEQAAALARLLTVLHRRRKVVVIAGAGISVAAGIPDFRSSTGLFKALKGEHGLKASGKQLFDASVYQTDTATSSFHDMVRNLATLVGDARPTAFHEMLAALARAGRLQRLYTQNVDGLDAALPGLETAVPLAAKGPWPRTVQLHGGLATMACSKCGALAAFAPALFAGPAPPPCAACVAADDLRTRHAGKRSHGVGRLRPRIVLYNEANPDAEAIGACVAGDLRQRPDALVVVGTSLKIPGVRRIVREMCGVVRGRRDGLTVWINHDAPPPGKDFEDCWDLIVKGPCDEVARQFAVHQEHEPCTQSDVEHAKERGDVRVVVASPSKPRGGVPASLLTPAASPRPKPAQPALPQQPLPAGDRPTIKIRVKNGKLSSETTAGPPPSKPPRGRKPGTKNRKGAVVAASDAQRPAPGLKGLLKTTKAGATAAPAVKGRPAKSTKIPKPERAPEPEPVLPPPRDDWSGSDSGGYRNAFRPPAVARPPRGITSSPPPHSPGLSPRRLPLAALPPPLFPNLTSPSKTPVRRVSPPITLPALPSTLPPPRRAAPARGPALAPIAVPGPGTGTRAETSVAAFGAGSSTRSSSGSSSELSALLSSASEPTTPTTGKAVAAVAGGGGQRKRDAPTISPTSCPRGMEGFIDWRTQPV